MPLNDLKKSQLKLFSDKLFLIKKIEKANKRIKTMKRQDLASTIKQNTDINI